jgi:hypothetical protein
MNLREHDERSEVDVWLSAEEPERFLAAAKNTEQRIAFWFGARCGLRSGEWLEPITRDDGSEGTFTR